MPIVWDEGEYLFRADRIVAWFSLLLDFENAKGGGQALSSAIIREHWLFVDWREGHPAWSAIPIALGKALLSGVINPLTAARLGPITVFSIACGALAFRLHRDYGTVAAVVAPILLVTLPRMFSDAHFATLDGQLTAWWLMLWAADSSVRRGTRTASLVGLLLGLTCATKFTGSFAAIPLVARRVLAGHRQQWRELFVIGPVALLVFYALNPPLWHDPITGAVDYVRLNLGRPDVNPFGAGSSQVPDWWAVQQRAPIDFFHYAFGAMTDLGQPYYPWYNTIAWLVFAAPVPALVLGIIGLHDCIRRRAFALPLHWAILMILRALPGAPSYDGIRLILPAFGFWCTLGGVGAQRVWDASQLRHHGWTRMAVPAVLGVSLAASAINVARYFPQTLSHYSLLVGGVRGAARLGMEPTYSWDALDDDVLEWINAHTPPDAAIAFSPISDFNVDLLRAWGRLRTEVTNPTWGTTFEWYVLLNRPGFLTAADRLLIRSEPPSYTKYVDHHGERVPLDLRAPLLFIFSYDQYKRAAVASGLE
jgi:hypothetical protein